MKVKLHYSLLGLLIILLFSGLYMEIILFFLVIILHELGHILFLVLFNQKIMNFNLTIVGGILDVEYKNLNIIKEVIISLAGVCVNGLILIVIKYLDDFYYQDILIKYNLLLIVFNLLPIYPLDGYKLIEALLRLENDPFKEQKFLRNLSALSLIITFSASIFYFKSLSIVFVFGFLIYHNIVLYLKDTQLILKKIVSRYNYKRVLE